MGLLTSGSVTTYEELLSDMESEEYRAAQTAVIDTGGTLVQLMKDWARGQDAKAAKDGRAMYGVIKTEFDHLCWSIRNRDKKHLVVVLYDGAGQGGLHPDPPLLRGVHEGHRLDAG